MNQITVRDIPSELERDIRKISHQKGQSLNKTIIELFHKGCGFSPEKRKNGI